jgi:hypothetical protein
MSSVEAERTLFTVPDPSIIGPKTDEIVLRSGIFETLTVSQLSLGSLKYEYTDGTATTTDGTPTQLYSLSLENNTSNRLVVKVLASSSIGETSTFTSNLTVKNVGGVLTTTILDFYSNTLELTSNISFTTSSSFIINCTGVVGKTIKWACYIERLKLDF